MCASNANEARQSPMWRRKRQMGRRSRHCCALVTYLKESNYNAFLPYRLDSEFRSRFPYTYHEVRESFQAGSLFGKRRKDTGRLRVYIRRNRIREDKRSGAEASAGSSTQSEDRQFRLGIRSEHPRHRQVGPLAIRVLLL